VIAAGWWFSPGTSVSSINKTDRNHITEIIYLYQLQKKVEKRTPVELFQTTSQRVKMDFIFSTNVRILCLSCNIKRPKAKAKLSKKKTEATMMRTTSQKTNVC
jgi:hypothetical protein